MATRVLCRKREGHVNIEQKGAIGVCTNFHHSSRIVNLAFRALYDPNILPSMHKSQRELLKNTLVTTMKH